MNHLLPNHPKKRSHSLIMTAPTALKISQRDSNTLPPTCSTCELKFSSESSLQNHETAKFHLKIKELRALGIHAIAVDVGGNNYKVMTAKEAQEHYKIQKQIQKALQNNNVWEHDTKKKRYICKPCRSSYTDTDMYSIKRHIERQKHQNALIKLSQNG